MVSIGDVVVMKDPENPESYLVRRLAAVGGHEMVSTDEKEDAFFLQQDECWVLSDNEALKPKVSLTIFFLAWSSLVIICLQFTERESRWYDIN